MSRPELPYNISLLDEALDYLRNMTKIADDLRLDLNKMRLHYNKVHRQNPKTLQNFKLQMLSQAVPVSDFSIYKVTYQKILVSSDMGPDPDPVQAIARVFIEHSNHEPHSSHFRNQTRFFTPLSCDL